MAGGVMGLRGWVWEIARAHVALHRQLHARGRHFPTLWFLALFFLTAPALAIDIKPDENYARHVHAAQSVSAVGDFGEQVSLRDGSLSISHTDLEWVGTGPTIRLTRTFRPHIWGRARERSGADFADWQLQIPRLTTMTADGFGSTVHSVKGWQVPGANKNARCSLFSSPGRITFMGDPLRGWDAYEWWNGVQLIDDQGQEQQLLAHGLAAPDHPIAALRTTGNWIVSCLPSTANGEPGEAFLATAPDGTRYWFNWLIYTPADTLTKSINSMWGARRFPHDDATRASPRAAHKAPETDVATEPLVTDVATDAPTALVADVATEAPSPVVTEAAKADTSQPVASAPARRAPMNDQLDRRYGVMLVTRIEDRFGNYLTYQYSGQQLVSISASDGRLVTLNNPGGVIASITAGSGATARTFQYGYSPDALSLQSVTQPDLSQWQFALTSLSQFPSLWQQPGSCRQPELGNDSQTGSGSLTAPSGATLSVSVRRRISGRSDVPKDCWNGDPDDPYDVESYSMIPIAWSGLEVTQRQMTGPGLVPANWTYQYSGPNMSWQHECTPNPACVTTVWGQVTEPLGGTVRETYSNRFGQGEQLLLERTVSAAGGGAVQIDTFAYANATPYESLPFPAQVGTDLDERSNPAVTAAWRPLKTRTRSRQAAVFTWQAHSFDSLARATHVQRSSGGTTADRARTDVTAYYDNTALWVLGQVASVTHTATSLVLEQTNYNAQALPWQMLRFGKLQATLAYHSDGNLASVTDGRNHTTTLNSWMRGIPQQIGFPATAEAPGGSTVSAVVNDHGWVTQKTDENGFTEAYQHDLMGRTTRVDYPAGDTTAWAPTLISFQAVNAAEYGIPAGHWKREESTGNRRDVTYFDGLWRPLVSERFDTANPTATRSIDVTRWDAQGRESFKSYPVAALSGYADTLSGVTTQHDVLDRITSLTQTSELGNLTTSVDYLAALQTKVTDPRGAVTQTAFTAWDEPTDTMPVQITLPEGRFTDLVRDTLGDVTSITRRNASSSESVTRRFVRDTHRRICKQIDPESGSTVRDFDAAENVAWQASGLNLPSTTSCDTAAAYGSGRRIDLTWDARNRETQRSFPDGRGNTSTTYHPDGLVHSKTAYNDPGNGAPVVHTVEYNRRRLPVSDTTSQPGWYSWTVTRGYDPIGNPSTLTYPNGLSVNYHPNALGQPTLVHASDGQTLASNLIYYPNGALQSFIYGNGIVHTMTQNARQLPSRSTDAGVMDYAFGYDSNANTIEILDHLRGPHYSRWLQWDLANRLTAAGSCSFGGDCWHRNTYDTIDNVRSWKLPGVKDYADYQYSTRNLPEQIRNSANATVVNQSFDLQGNLSAKNTQGYDFDFGNRMRSVAGKQWFRYDGFGHRALRWEWAESGILALYTHDNTLTYDVNHRASSRTAHSFVQLQGSRLAIRETNLDSGANAWKFQHTDALGSPVAITDQSGTVVERTEWEPWGAAIGKPAMDTVGYTGHQMDGSTGLIHMQQRYYDPDTAQFLSVDPVNVDLSTGDHFNRRWYVNNNPYKFMDPDGRQEFALGGAALGCAVTGPACPVGGAVGGVAGVAVDAIKWGIILYATYRGAKHLSESESLKRKNRPTDKKSFSQSFTNSPQPPDDEDQPASEKTGTDVARRVEKDLGKSARRELHELKEKGANDRSLKQLREDAKSLYIERNKEVPKWLDKL